MSMLSLFVVQVKAPKHYTRQQLNVDGGGSKNLKKGSVGDPMYPPRPHLSQMLHA